MPALNFEKRFAEMVRSGEKLQTIRAPRKRQICEGDQLYLYTGMRTKACVALGKGVCCEVSPITIAAGAIFKNVYFCPSRWRDQVARKDGFESWFEMRDWFRDRHGLPFNGVLIRWELQ